ncbi:uncharacterized protein [Aquarana catesbeiana]|uniref:uncharacterized protein isoform X2 n=1 Tax=Aquarana catesbeiana TaxID=8400 RepID=UPI003CC9AAB0
MWHERRVLWIQMVAINFFLLWKGVAYGGPRIYIKVTKNISDHKDQSVTIPGVSTSNKLTNVTNGIQDISTTIQGVSTSNEMTSITNGIQDTGDSNEMTKVTNDIQDISTTIQDSSYETANGNQDQAIIIPISKEQEALCSTTHSQQTGDPKGGKTSDPTPAPSTKNEVAYWIIGLICGIILLLFIIAIVLLYKFYIREQPDTECTQEIPLPQVVPPDDMSHLYAKVQKAKSKENCSSGVDDINYSSVKFVKEVPTEKVEQSDTDYTEIKCT